MIRCRFFKVLLIGVFAAGATQAQGKKVKRSDLPVPAQKTADEQSKEAVIRGYSSEVEDGKLEYEVQLTVNGRSRDVAIAPDGRVLEIEDEVLLSQLPAQVRVALKSKAGEGTITKVESLTRHGRLVAYEAQVRTGSKHSEIQVGPNGAPLAHPE